jgi:hypothetical protein
MVRLDPILARYRTIHQWYDVALAIMRWSCCRNHLDRRAVTVVHYESSPRASN